MYNIIEMKLWLCGVFGSAVVRVDSDSVYVCSQALSISITPCTLPLELQASMIYYMYCTDIGTYMQGIQSCISVHIYYI